jgi:hypothetical protein
MDDNINSGKELKATGNESSSDTLDDHVFTTMLKIEGEQLPKTPPSGARKSITSTPGTAGKESVILAKDWGQLGNYNDDYNNNTNSNHNYNHNHNNNHNIDTITTTTRSFECSTR